MGYGPRHIVVAPKNFEAVIDSRWLQEQQCARKRRRQFADRSEVAACAHYESWTLGIWDDLGARADFVFGRNADYEYFPLKAMNNSDLKVSGPWRETISHHIELIYPADDAHALNEKICAAPGSLYVPARRQAELPWSEADGF